MSGCTLYAQAEHGNSTLHGGRVRDAVRSLTQSARLQADKGNFAPLAEVENIFVLAGAHGLFFREKLLSPHISSEKTGRMGAVQMSAPPPAAQWEKKGGYGDKVSK